MGSIPVAGANGADSFSAEPKRSNDFRKKRFFRQKLMEKAFFSVEILTDFTFFVHVSIALLHLNETAPLFFSIAYIRYSMFLIKSFQLPPETFEGIF